MRLPVNPIAGSLMAIAAGLGLAAAQGRVPAPANGPAADYPVVVGDAYSAGGTQFVPSDTMNYDAVGYATTGSEGGSAISAAHHTLPLPSYVEVTALDTGRTILVRVERRGPMGSANLIELSPGAAAQLGLSGAKAAVRVRRVNPPESERAMLRGGASAPERMATPKSLLDVLTRRLAPDATVSLTGPAPAAPAPVAAPQILPAPVTAVPAPHPHVEKPGIHAIPAPSAPAPAPSPVPAPKPSPRPTPKPVAKPTAAAEAKLQPGAGQFTVQAGAFSVKANAEAVAGRLGGSVSAAGKLWRVRTGPYGSRAEAEAALAKAKAAGYSEARIQRAD